MFGVILGHGTPTQAVPVEGSRQERTKARAERRHPAGSRGLAGVIVAATGCGDQRAESISDATFRPAGDPDDRQAISTIRPGAGVVREKANRACGTVAGV